MDATIRFALLTVAAHAVVAICHAAAHQRLGIEMSASQTSFIVADIIIAPLVAGVWLWKRAGAAGAFLLTLSMAGALVFGVYHHFVASSADHVAHVAAASPGVWAKAFQVTAVLLALVETLGVGAGLWALKRILACRS